MLVRSVMSALESPSIPNSKESGDAVSHVRDVIHSQLGIAQALIEDGDCLAAARVSEIVGTRGCRLSACAIAATVRQTGNDKPDGDKVIFGLDGSLVEFYPRFEQRIRDALIELLGEDVEKRISIVMAKDGSGVGGKHSVPVHHFAEKANPDQINLFLSSSPFPFPLYAATSFDTFSFEPRGRRQQLLSVRKLPR